METLPGYDLWKITPVEIEDEEWCSICEAPREECDHEPPIDKDDIATLRWERSRDE